MKFIEQPQIDQFLTTNLETIIQKEQLGENNFQDAYNHLKHIHNLISEEIDLLKNIEGHDILKNKILGYVSTFNSNVSNILNYRMAPDPHGEYRKQLIKGVINWYEQIYALNKRMDDPYTHDYFLVHYLTVKDVAIRGKMGEINKLFKELKENVEDSKEILNSAKEAAQNYTASSFANIFKDESEKHSHIEWKKVKFGASEKWLGFAILLLLVFTIFFGMIRNELSIYKKNKVTVTDQKTNIIKIKEEITDEINFENLLTRVLIISIFIYLFVHSLKQFSIHRHLATINKHRQNALNSYKLFSGSMDKGSPLTNALMMQVAKAIYESNSTGYLVGKEETPSSSIIELTKFMDKQQ